MLDVLNEGPLPHVPLKDAAAKLQAPKLPAPHGVIQRVAQQVDFSWLAEPPPERECLFETLGERADEALPLPVLPASIVGMLAAAGGVGKTEIAIMMAVSIATGRPFLSWTPARTGRVLLALAEEDEGEARRRIYRVARGMRLTDEERLRVAARVYVAPLAGTPVSLLERGENGNPVETEVMRDLRALLATPGEPWALVVIDPLARWGGPDCEIDNAQATRAVEAFETLTKAPGRPTVLVVHHTSKRARSEGDRDATASRGASALTDGMRWVALLSTKEIGEIRAVRLEIVKNNYCPPSEPLTLTRDVGGALRLLTESEIETSKLEAEAAKAANIEARILELVEAGEYTSVDELRRALGANKTVVSRVVGELKRSGRLTKVDRYAPFEVVK